MCSCAILGCKACKEYIHVTLAIWKVMHTHAETNSILFIQLVPFTYSLFFYVLFTAFVCAPCPMPGYKQELGRHEPTVVESNFEGSSLFDHLLHLWSVGDLSATACQALGAAAHRDGLQHPAIIKLASLGAWGTCTNNISMDLKGLVARESKGTFPRSELAQSIPCRNPSANNTEPADIHFFNAASVVASLFNSQEQFDAAMKPELVGTFWSNIKNDDPKLQILLKETSLTKADLPRVVPLWLHGDGVEYVDGRSCPSLQSSLLLFALPKDC